MIPTLTRNPNLTALPRAEILPNEVQTKFGHRWWTGVAPENCLGFSKATGRLHALPILNFRQASRQDIIDYFNNTWTLTELLFSGLKTESTYVLPAYHQLRHPLIFYYGHPAVLTINKLRVAGLVQAAIDPYLENILEVGVDEMSWDDLSKNTMKWPRVEDIHQYRSKVYQTVLQILKTHPDLDHTGQKDLGPKHPLWALWLSMEHEKIHLETSSVLMRELPLDLLEKPTAWPSLHPSANSDGLPQPLEGANYQSNSWVVRNGDSVHFGKSTESPFYGWDNEYGHRDFKTQNFRYSQSLVSNGEYYEFVRSGDYVKDEFWSEEGRAWRKFRNIKRPTFWTSIGPEGLHAYGLRTIFELIPMPWSWPVEVNFHEAKAFCAWRSQKEQPAHPYRLLSENEFQLLQRDRYRNIPQTPAKSGDSPVSIENLNLKWGSPEPVSAQIAGNVWQWMEDQFNPLEGFKTHPYYEDFSTPCFDGRHQMILGGSFVSCGHEAAPSARFHFRPHFFQHSGFRMAAGVESDTDNGAIKLHLNHHGGSIVDNFGNADLTEILKTKDWWKEFHQPLHATPEEWNQYFNVSQSRVFKFLSEFAKKNPGGSPHTQEGYRPLRSFPQGPSDLAKVLDSVFQGLSGDTQWPGHPRYSAYVAGSTNPISAVAQWIAAVLNPYTAHHSFAPGFVELEAESIRWFLELFGFPKDRALGFYTTGGSVANLSALSTARRNKLKGSDLSKARVYASAQAHHCISKNLAFLGFPTDTLQLVATDVNFKTDLVELETQIQQDLAHDLQPFCIVGTAGTTNSGAVDDLRGLSGLAKKFNLWFHVDGAYGALFMLTELGRETLAGIESADSLAFDPHKTLGLPYGTGAVLFRDRYQMLLEYQAAKSYMPPSHDFDDSGLRVDYANITPELSREFRGLRVWLPLKVFGIEPFILNLEEKSQMAQWLYQELAQMPKLEMGPRPQLSIVLFRARDVDRDGANQKTMDLLKQINESGVLFLSGCEIEGIKYIRVALISHQQHFAEIRNFRDQLQRWLA